MRLPTVYLYFSSPMFASVPLRFTDFRVDLGVCIDHHSNGNGHQHALQVGKLHTYENILISLLVSYITAGIPDLYAP